ncbi:hypothetical protein C8F04DRAFT_1086583 [Mycena alexandri]|uniref:DUF6593 domain-containing protein n=1 Tax=Mycena alexandri TaxID=1745969 RepID=A0AAD6T5T2_9AGAR|nr:hypothetical protein C8F04DRAFT_1086583 [Mycena alexandri]
MSDLVDGIHLTFETNSMLATKIFQDTTHLYTLSTDKHGSTTSLLVAGTDTLIAKMERKELFPDTVAFPGSQLNNGKAKQVKKWLRPTLVAEGVRAYTIEMTPGNFFLLRHPQYRLALYTPDLQEIIAHWLVETKDSPLRLVIASDTEKAAFPQIIAAFVYEEQNMRVVEKHDIVAGRTPAFRVRVDYPFLGMLPHTGEVNLAALAGSRQGNAWQ